MKIHIDIDVSPEEFRKLMGWPDVQGFHQDMLDAVRERMANHAEGYDPLTLLKPYLQTSIDGMAVFSRWVDQVAAASKTSGA